MLCITETNSNPYKPQDSATWSGRTREGHYHGGAMPTSCKKIYKREGDQNNTPRAKQGYCLASVYLTSTKTQINVCFFVINFALFFNLKKNLFGYTVPAVTRRDFIKHQAAIALRIISHNNHKEVKK